MTRSRPSRGARSRSTSSAAPTSARCNRTGAAYGASMDERLLKQLGIDQRIVQQLIEEQAALAEAKRQGITATDEEIRQRILAIPAFQENGQFIGYDRYRQMLQMQDPPVRENQFEEQVRRSIVVEKLQAALTNWITVTDAEVEADFKKRNEKVKLAVVSLPVDKFREAVKVDDAEIATWFEQKKNDYRIPEKRKIRYALVDVQTIRERIQVSPQDVQRSYEDNQQQDATPEQAAPAISFSRLKGKTSRGGEAGRRSRGQGESRRRLRRAREEAFGRRFEEHQGWRSRLLRTRADGRRLRQVAFAIEPGEVSDPVKTEFGYHVIKLMEKRAASQRPLAEVRGADRGPDPLAACAG